MYSSGSQPLFGYVPSVKYVYSQVPPNQRKTFLMERGGGTGREVGGACWSVVVKQVGEVGGA